MSSRLKQLKKLAKGLEPIVPLDIEMEDKGIETPEEFVQDLFNYYRKSILEHINKK